MPRPNDRPHARIYRAWMDIPAWTTPPPVAQALLVNLLTRYRPMEPNAFEISDRSATTLVTCARNTASKALAELVDRGWLRVIRVGRIRGPKAKRASVYALTAFPEELGMPAAKDFLRWRPHPIQGLTPKPSTAQFRAVNGSLQPPAARPAALRRVVGKPLTTCEIVRCVARQLSKLDTPITTSRPRRACEPARTDRLIKMRVSQEISVR